MRLAYERVLIVNLMEEGPLLTVASFISRQVVLSCMRKLAWACEQAHKQCSSMVSAHSLAGDSALASLRYGLYCDLV